jgi:hypothetical protein
MHLCYAWGVGSRLGTYIALGFAVVLVLNSSSLDYRSSWHAVVGVFSYPKKNVCASSLNQQDTYISFCGWIWTSPRVNLVKGCWLLYGSIVSVALPPLW